MPVSFVKLDSVFTRLDAPTRKFANETSYYVGTVQDLNPGAYPALRAQFDSVMTALTTFRRAYIVIKEGGANGPTQEYVDKLTATGERLLAGLENCNRAAKDAKPSDFAYYVKGTAKVALEVAQDIAEGLRKTGERVLAAGDFLTKNLVWVLGIGLFAWFVLPKIVSSVLSSKGSNK